MEDRDSILIDFEEAGPRADLAQWVRRYPEHARDLTRRAMQRRLPAACPESDASLAAIGLAALASARARTGTPLASLKAAAEARGLDPDAVAEGLGLPVTYFWKLHRRLFRPDSVPSELVGALAGLLNRTAAEIAAYLAKPPLLAAGASYRADTAPRIGARESFADALESDPDLTPEQRDRWREPKRP